jgi:hypothetical protein
VRAARLHAIKRDAIWRSLSVASGLARLRVERDRVLARSQSG